MTLLWTLTFLFSDFCQAQLVAVNDAQGSPAYDELKKVFTKPGDTVQTSIYWYWISDNISKEGVVKDLQAMKKVGINRAFIGNIGLDETPYGKVKLFSNEWWDILHTALKTATVLNIEIGIFNSPGWSQSGGPWIKSSQSMRYLTSSEISVVGSREFSAILKKPSADFQDVRVIAFPSPQIN
ncbi:MAG TPA: glycosyl hydrolase, partial [Flavitalea sp.]|nr:glycosyl hydrolase [Flavitalea sp.]